MKGDSKGDFTRLTFDALKHYSGVQMQQGRVQLDADWNEEVDIIDHRWRATLEDTVGPSGAPKVGGGFFIQGISAGGVQDLSLSPGRIYVDGILCQLDAPYVAGSVVSSGTLSVVGTHAGQTPFTASMWIEVATTDGNLIAQAQVSGVTAAVAPATTSQLSLQNLSASLPAPQTAVMVRPLITYLTQPDLPSPQAIDMSVVQGTYFGNTYVAYLDVFERLITALDDPEIREVALNGPDTGTRSRTTWQVRLALMPSMSTCDDVHLPANPPATSGPYAMPVASTGVMQARAVPTSDPQTDCLLPAEAGYRRLENQLYRVEIHKPGNRATAQFKWSRDNGALAFAWTSTSADKTQIMIKSRPQDAAQGFASGQWVELTDDSHDLSADPSVLGTFVQLSTPISDETLSVVPGSALGSVVHSDFPTNPKLRRWDSGLTSTNDPGGADGWIALEDGVEVKFPVDGWFNKGDYWLIPARTATTDIDWPNDPSQVPLAQPPHGVEHSYCPLAMVYVHSGNTITTVDCRPLFPALTEIAATDVSYDNTNCELVNATNVQQALDALCRRDDLKRHNKLIHGWGIVGGLQVECSPKGPLWVMVRNGYAVDCNGNDIDLPADTAFDLGQLMLPLQNPLGAGGNGELSLVIGLDQNAQVQVTAEPYTPPKTEFDEIFSGTLLLDVVNDFIKPFQAFMAAELAKFPGNPPVTAGEELASAFVDLLAQGPNPQAGHNVYISSAEHQLLSTFYTDFRAWLHSDTFCGLFANAQPYPALTDGTLPHAFGRGQSTRIKYRPNTNEYFTLSNGTDPTLLEPRINHFKSDLLIEQLDPTGGTATGPIVDFTFSPDGNTIYVILHATNSTDTLYRTGTFGQAGLTWSPQLVTFTNVRLGALEGTGLATPQLVAVAPGVGLYEIDLAKITGTSVQLQVTSAFDASGQLEVNDLFGYVSFAAAPWSSGSAPAGTFDRIRVIEIFTGGSAPSDITLPAPATDAIAWGGSLGLTVFVIPGATTKTITGYSYFTQWTQVKDTTGKPMAIPVDNCAIIMAAGYSGTSILLFWASQDFYTLNLVDATTYLPVNGWTLPMQVGPADIAFSPASAEMAVLHRPSDSVLRIPTTYFGTGAAVIQSTQAVWNNAILYHPLAAKAYLQLLAGFVQYLKDCFCHHLLVKTNECTPASQKLYLACISIRNSAVYNVCNFSGRHYLKTFPTIGYWLSLFPLVPMVSELIELLCCYILPDAAAKHSAPKYSKPVVGSSPQWSLQSLFNTMQEIQGLDVRGKLTDLLSKVGLARHVVGYSLGFRQLAAPTAPSTASFAIGKDVASAQGALAQAGMVSQVKAFVPAVGPQLVSNLIDVFRPAAGPTGPVALHEAAGQVVFTSNLPAPATTAAAVQAPAPTPAQTPAQTAAQAQMAAQAVTQAIAQATAHPQAQATAQPTVASLQLQIQAKDAQLQAVQTQLATMSQQIADLHTFKAQVTQQLGTSQAPQAPAGGATPPKV